MKTLPNLLFAFVLASFTALVSTSANAMGDKQWAGFYGGFTSAFLGASSPKDNLEGSLKKQVGGSAGLIFGWNYVSDQFLFGVEGDAQVASMRLRHKNLGITNDVQITSTSSVRARAGMIFGEDRDYLAYVTGGVAFTGVETDVYGMRDDKTVPGFAIGGGLEMWLFGNDWITTTFEYLYTDVPGKSYKSGHLYSKAQELGDYDKMSSYRFKTGIHQIRGAWNLHF